MNSEDKLKQEKIVEAYQSLQNRKQRRAKQTVAGICAFLGINIACTAGVAICSLVSVATAGLILGFASAMLINAVAAIGFIMGKHIYDKKQNAKEVQQFEKTYHTTELGAEFIRQKMLLKEKEARREAQARDIFPEIFDTPTSCKPHTQKTFNKNMENENFENIDDATHTR